MNKYFTTLVFILFAGSALSNKILQHTDSVLNESMVAHSTLQFDQELVKTLKSNRDFMYELPPEARPNILRLLFQRLFQWLVLMLGNELIAWFVVLVLIVLGVVGLGFALFGFFGVGKTSPVYTEDTGPIEYQVKDENIHALDFTAEIALALRRQEFRSAIRLTYLHALQVLTAKELIDWAPHKTNHDYLQEVRPGEYQALLATLVFYFEYAWYGDFQVNRIHYDDTRKAFLELLQKLKHS